MLSPIAVGTSDIPKVRFIVLNAVAAIFWAVLFTAIGYALGDGLKALFQRVQPFAHVLVTLLLARLVCRTLHHRSAAKSDDALRSTA